MLFAKPYRKFRLESRKPPAVSSLLCEPDDTKFMLDRLREAPLMAGLRIGM